MFYYLLVALLCRTAVGQGFSWIHEFSCPPGEVYDTSGLTCAQCGENEVANESCECKAGYRRTFSASEFDGSAFGTCEECTTGASSVDRLRCVACDSSTGLQQRPASLRNGQCVCSENADGLGLIIERDASGALLQDNGTFVQQCVVCSAPPADGDTACGSCEYPKVMNSAGECVCPTTLPSDIRCSNTNALQRVASSLRVDIGTQPYAVSSMSSGSSDSIVISTSAALKEYLDEAVEGCHDFGNTRSCNTLANLCAIQQYDRYVCFQANVQDVDRLPVTRPVQPVDSHFLQRASCFRFTDVVCSEALACNIFKEISQIRVRELYRPNEVTSSVAWAKSLPWLYYPEGINALALESKDVGTEMRFRGGSLESGAVSQLTFLLAAYTLSGDFLGLRPIGTVLQVCGARAPQSHLWTHVGTDYQNECTIDLTDLAWESQNSTLLYDLYFVDGVVDSDSDTSDNESGFGELLRRQLGGTPVLFPVPLILHRSDEAVFDAEGNDVTSSEMELARRFFTVDTWLGTPAGDSSPTWIQYLASAILVIEMSSESRSRIKPPRLHLQYGTRRLTPDSSATPATSAAASTTRFDVRYLNSAAVQGQFHSAWSVCMGIFVSLGLLCGLVQSLKWKERKKAAGSDDDYSFLLCVLGNSAHCTGVALTAVALVLSLHAFVLFKGQRDSFLYVVPNAALADLRLTIILAAVFLGWSVVYTIYCQTRLTDVAMIDWERPQQVINEDGQHSEGTVSCWRSILIANAFNSLSVQRRARPALTFFILILFLEVGGWKRAALTSASSTEDVCPGTLQRSDALAFGAAAGGYLIAVGCQLVVRLLLSSLRLPQLGNLEDPRFSFMDLLYFTNISLCIFDEPTAGYYLDGKFMEPRSDDSLQKLTRNLEKQRAGSILRKVESQLVFVGGEMYEAYTLKKLELRWGPQNASIGARAAALVSTLKSFMEDSPQVVDPTFWQRWTRDVSVREKVDSSDRRTVHTRDAHSMWSSALFYGQELQLVCLEVTFMGAIDLALRNTLTSAVVTWMVSAALALARRELGRRNLARCTLVDLRFLS